MANKNNPKLTNDHYLYIRSSGLATNEQLMKALKTALEGARAATKKKLPCLYNVNLVSDRDGKPSGYGYIWVSNPEVYHLLLGRNIDGTERVECFPDPTWVPKDDDFLEAALNIPYQKGMSWADMADEEDILRAEYECKIMRRVLPPLMKIPPIVYTPQQIEVLKKQIKGEGEVIPAQIEIVCEGAHVYETDDTKYKHNVLYCAMVPLHVTEKDMKILFSPYTSDTQTPYVHRVNGETIKETYPFVRIVSSSGKRCAYITFNERTQDAQFALLMTRRVNWIARHDKSLITPLYFNLCYK